MLSSSLSFGRFFENHSPFWEKGRKFPWFLTSQLSSFLARPTSDVDSRANMGGRGDWWSLMGPPFSEKNATAIRIFSRDILPFILFLYFLCVLFRCWKHGNMENGSAVLLSQQNPLFWSPLCLFLRQVSCTKVSLVGTLVVDDNIDGRGSMFSLAKMKIN